MSSSWQPAHTTWTTWRSSSCPKSTDPVVPAISSGSVYCKLCAAVACFQCVLDHFHYFVYVITCPVFGLRPSQVVSECRWLTIEPSRLYWCLRGSLFSSASRDLSFVGVSSSLLFSVSQLFSWSPDSGHQLVGTVAMYIVHRFLCNQGPV